jgi:transcriptional regulator with XRE-family HTH domain
LIGSKIKEIRKSKAISLTELSEKSGVQIATLSRMENQKMTGTLESHIQIAKALDIDLTELYKDVGPDAPKNNVDLRHDSSPAEIFNYSEKSSYEILTTKVLARKMMPVLLKIEPKGCTNKEQYASGTEKFVFVIEGHIKVSIANKTYALGPGNTLYFDASLAHIFTNEDAKMAKLVCVTTPVTL